MAFRRRAHCFRPAQARPSSRTAFILIPRVKSTRVPVGSFPITNYSIRILSWLRPPPTSALSLVTMTWYRYVDLALPLASRRAGATRVRVITGWGKDDGTCYFGGGGTSRRGSGRDVAGDGAGGRGQGVTMHGAAHGPRRGRWQGVVDAVGGVRGYKTKLYVEAN